MESLKRRKTPYFFQTNYIENNEHILRGLGRETATPNTSIIVWHKGKEKKKKEKRKTNWIDGLLNSQGQWCTGVDQLKDIGENHFKELFTSSTPSRLDEALLVVEKVISPDMSNKLTQPFSATKIQQAICQMHLSKALGPDGMSYLF
jgi:hypothetical protein